MKTINIRIDAKEESAFNEHIKKANKKLLRVGQVPLTIASKTIEHTFKVTESKNEIPIDYINYEIECPDITGLENVEYVGTISVKDGIKTVYSEDDSITLGSIPTESLHCDHCNVNRYRNKYHIFRKDGAVLQIGSSCAKDYFGHDIERILSIVHWFISEENWNDGPAPVSYDLIDNVIAAVAITTQEGRIWWVGKEKAAMTGNLPTSSLANGFLAVRISEYLKEDYELYKAFLENNKETIEKVKTNLTEYVKSLSLENDFEYNLHNNLLHDDGTLRSWTLSRNFGLVSYVVWKMFHDEYERTHENVEKKESNHQGFIGDRITCTITVTKKVYIESDYGSCNLYIMVDADGNVYKTFYSGYKISMNEDETYIVKGTIKAHDEYNGQKQTMLTRIALM